MTATTADELLYDDLHIGFLERLWGDGFLSPGGADEAMLVVEGLDLRGKRVLDIGSGSGAVACLLARAGAAEVIGIDVESPVCEAARRRVTAEGLSDKVRIDLVEPGPLPFEAEHFDLVYSKDSIIHIPDKETLCRDVWRVLKTGGWFAASDWLMSHDGPPSPEMAAYIKAEDLDFAMASPDRYRRAMVDAGFGDIELRNRNPWYAATAKEEYATLTGPERGSYEAAFGADFIAGQITTWTAMMTVLDSGEHCPHHIRGRK